MYNTVINVDTINIVFISEGFLLINIYPPYNVTDKTDTLSIKFVISISCEWTITDVINKAKNKYE